MIVDVRDRHRGDALPLGRYYPIVIETDAERAELECALSSGWGRGPEKHHARPDHRPSNIWSDRVLISRNDPPQPGWPSVSVTRSPDRIRADAVDRSDAIVRGRCTMELFATAAGLEIHWAYLLDAAPTGARHQMFHFSLRLGAVNLLAAPP